MITCLSAIFGLAGCRQEGSAENAEQKHDPATSRADQKIKETKEPLDQKADKTEEQIDDLVITMNVKTAILNDSLLNASHIDATTVKGVVKLTGIVDSEQSIGRAMEMAGNQKHVKSVKTDLTVNANTPSK
ncbi:MAG: BON domain-containing protein [Methylobacter sp.]|nr:BON domain-containing protein [Methylobacter sp.]